ncbi:hypothetical protein Tco_1004694 [Tanacetum coccineum]|uniref:Reverse transcriptase domain-containing protein n=1 Tax=Tanacetum coccineum TaxID=301880 RepID=A0ABQ5FCK9_9ASTR
MGHTEGVDMEMGDMFRQTGKVEPSLYRTFQDPCQEEIQIDDKLYFFEEPVEIMEREVKRLKQSRILIVKVRWNSKRGPEFTWEHEDQFKKKYPHLFAKSSSLPDIAS